jgi:hypothetical protein
MFKHFLILSFVILIFYLTFKDSFTQTENPPIVDMSNATLIYQGKTNE